MTDREKLVELLEAGRTISPGSNYASAMADHLIANGVTVQKWIPVKEHPPKERERVLTLDKWGHTHDRKLRRMLNGMLLFSPDGLVPGTDVTHWMPMPEPPKEEV